MPIGCLRAARWGLIGICAGLTITLLLIGDVLNALFTGIAVYIFWKAPVEE